ncbi:preprotein translocase subunit SecA [Frankia sp. Cppng1_Ct_nod]|uniref:preprotein translocase subunit SecA n=1 Tax=Frankia sp. Cppng1_Ct_nod TaxID=2897162 RepID=UPI0010417F73|nr:preprotein translocase subunit SecA [Frankia sp. Cppng1_Ct_nod]
MVLEKILRAGEGRILRKLKAITEQVSLLEEDFVGLTDAELRSMTDEFRQRLDGGEETLDELLPEAFAAVREAARRTLGQRHFDVQIMGGAALHLGNIAEMKTGEGKTLVSTLPAYLNALSRKGVHIVTVNDYLAQRDAENMGRVHRFLGLTVGVIHPQMSPAVRRQQYEADITYGTNNEFGFDYLRDNMSWSGEELVQRGHNFAVVDEVDSILVDEARTPLIISGPADNPTRWYTEFARLAPMLVKDTDYEVEEGKRTVAIAESGVAKIEDQLGIENLYESVNTPLVGYLNNALKAKELYRRDKDYIVTDGEVLIVDEFTGRVLHGRRYSEGMHQAIEAKEKVEIKQENQTLATITLQNYFRLYDKLSGMTGTAMTEAAEFHQIYVLGVVPIPTNKEMVRADQPDVVYKTEVAKFNAVVDDIAERNNKGQPVLVGTTSVAKSEYLSKQLTKRGVKHEVLNAKHHEREASIIAEAGRKGAVTVATNMAGRGTDIMLGGNPEFLAQAELRQRGLSPIETPEDYEAAWLEALEKARASVAAEHEDVVAFGGLYVLGTERHESRRIDNQLRGRAGRQGDRGESRFYLSLGDDLMRLFNAAAVEGIMDRLNIPEDVPIESKIVTRAIRSAQTQVEGQNFEIRKNVLKYDEVMNKQRTVIYEERRKVLEGADLHEQVRHFIDDTVEGYVRGATAEGYPEEWDLDTLWSGLGELYRVGVEVPSQDEREGLTTETLIEDMQADAHEAYDQREDELGVGPDGEPLMRELERRVVLAVLDRKWREHLYEMDYLQEGIGLRAMGQRDPLVEYQREGYDMFQTMMEGIKEESVRLLFNAEVQVPSADSTTPEAVGTAAGTEIVPADRAAQAAGEAGLVAAVRAATAGASAPAPSAVAASADVPGRPVVPTPPPVFVKGLEPRRPTGDLRYTAPSVDGGSETVTTRSSGDVLGVGDGESVTSAGTGRTARNAPCPCGSGRKYKRCHGDPSHRSTA